MLITREMDYCVRIVRALKDGGQLSANEIAAAEHIQTAVTNKLLKKLSKGGILESRRGQMGGYRLLRSCGTLTLYDLFSAMESVPRLTECIAGGYDCPNNAAGGCGVHGEFCRIQRALDAELRRYSLAQLFGQPQEPCAAADADAPAAPPAPQ